ncbi:50S ribosomal protein L25/general stress protein Ctc [Agrococcus sp. Marseille-Q4369]|uniref:50S ribosomal protein L25/general stress protein Ctc n=1 Tax=Agrococcus sp. Marseille-Q4369 TaxID=2810513 RepID=UPI001B8BCC7C|nr:50S ribosomal protein L25/general stress protein Ctc [Agrococcus sp. Marseille-Q4369]QUW18604.1 50S ribosomal protein L25/general stress protein Ctc [Agrococcus sp. Marseille-Q4369]
MSDNKLETEPRTSFGKGAARKIRAAGKVPAVLYGHGTEPKHLTLDAHQVFLLVRRSNAILDLQVDGASQLALVKDVQRNPVLQGRDAIEHLDLLIVKRGEKVIVDVPVHLEGESYPGTINNLEETAISVEVDALNIPDSIVVSIEGLEEGAQVLASDIQLPAGTTLVTEPDTLVVGIMVPAAPTLDDESAEGDVVPSGEASQQTDA